MEQIPIIDLSPALHGSAEEKYQVAMQIDKACKEIGFIVVHGHDISPDVFTQMYTGLETFFNLPIEEKQKCKLDSGFTMAKDDYTPYGYSGLLEENAFAYMGEKGKPSDYVEKFSTGRLILDDSQPLPFPKTGVAKSFRQDVKTYYQACEQLSVILTRLFALALELPEDFFASKTDRSNDSLRLQTYPGFSHDFANRQGMAEHTDGTLMTILTDTSPGIEVKLASGEWVRPMLEQEGHFLVNIGDLMMRWSNDEYVSTRHRVVLSDQKRQSIVYFKLANDDTVIESFPKFTQSRRAKYPPIVYKDFSLEKMDALFSRDKSAT
ncbi:MAG: 2-oxoglutarate and iron-dependent oxygenase domain-containing protein [Paracoccaceae bacterium]